MEKIKRLRLKKNFFLYSFLTLVIVGYSFFFVGGNFMFDNVRVEASTIGKVFEHEKRNITLLRWDYSKEQQLMEVELSVQNLAYDGINDYEFTCELRPSSDVSIKQIISEDSFIVLQIENIPSDFTEISLRFIVPGTNTWLRLYSNKEAINYVDTLTAKSLVEYEIDSLLRTIENHEKDISELDNLIKDKETEIENITASILSDEERKKYMTADEIEDINKTIDDRKELISSSQALIQNYQLQINEIRAKIDNINKQIEDLRQ